MEEFSEKPRCRRCGRKFPSGRALNIHISKKHLGEDPAPTFYGEGILGVEKKGDYADIRVRVRKGLWDGIVGASRIEKLEPEEAVIASLVSITTGPAWWFTGSRSRTTPIV